MSCHTFSIWSRHCSLDPAKPSSRREFATDGKRLYFTIAEHESDIWTMELKKQ